MGFGTRFPKILLKATPFTLALNVTSALFYTRIVAEKYATLENKKKMFVACRQ